MSLKVSIDVANTTWSGREFQAEGPKIENDHASNLFDIGTTSLLLILVAEHSLKLCCQCGVDGEQWRTTRTLTSLV